MLNRELKLEVFYSDNTAFTDFSDDMADFARDQTAFTWVAAEDFIYIGFEKPVNAFYIELQTVNALTASLTLEYYNGTSFTALEGILDEGKGLTRNGFIHWDRNQTDEAKTTVNSVEKNWYRLSLDVDTTFTIQGIGIVFSDDNDIEAEYPGITSGDNLPPNQTTFVLQHMAARDQLIQDLRNDGFAKRSNNTLRVKQIEAYDILDIGEIKLASMYLTLSKIFSGLVDSPDDVYWQKMNEYKTRYNSARNLFWISLDLDNDGVVDESERLRSYSSSVVRR